MMVSKRCRDCGKEARPRLVHPSTLRAEVTVWLVALTVGAGAGIWSAITTPPHDDDRSAVRRLAVTVVQSETDPATPPSSEYRSEEGLGMRAMTWARDAVWRFVRTAWWVLPLPLLFSLWRQFATREACIGCHSRRLEPMEPAPDPFAL